MAGIRFSPASIVPQTVQATLPTLPSFVQVAGVICSACGVCGSDLHYFLHGHIGPYVVEQPMILGHEASGVVAEVGVGVVGCRR